MSDPLLWLLTGLGFGGAFVSGLLGVGGAIVMIPLLLYVPPLVGLADLGIRTVAGISIVQVFAASLAGTAGHLRAGAIDRPLAIVLGTSMTAAALAGGLVSGFVDPVAIEAAFAAMATAAAALVLLRRHRMAPESAGRPVLRRGLTIAIGSSVGFLAGIVGAGGAFLIVPLMLHVLRVPMRVAVGTSLVSVAISALAALTGKAVTGQIDWALATALVVGALPGGLVGSTVSRRTHPERLAIILGVIIALVAVRMWLQVAGRLVGG